MAAPSFVQASTGATDASGTFTFTGVATGTVGDLVILQILNDGTGVISWGTLSGTNIQNLAGTANVWTDVGIFFAGAAAQQRIFMGRRTSAVAAPTFTASANTSGDDVYGRMYEFSNASTGTTLATVIENSTAGGTNTSGVTSSNTASDAAVTTLGPDRLALNFVGVNDDNAISAFTGETGGDWTLAVAPYADSGGTDGAIGLQIAYPGVAAASESDPSSVGVSGGTGTQEQIAQSFSLAAGVTAPNVKLLLAKVGSPTDNLVVEIQTDSAGAPSGSVVGSSVSLNGTAISNNYIWTGFAVNASLSAGTTYWVVARRDGARDTSNFYSITISTSSTYASGTAAHRDSGTWANYTADLAFSVDSATGATIDGGTGSIVDIDSWGVVGFALLGTTVAWEQTHYRFRNDDGTETTATWLADLDTDVN